MSTNKEKKWCDWSELLEKKEDYQHTPTALWATQQSGGKAGGVDPLNKSQKINKDGKEPYRPSNEEIAKFILKGLGNTAQWKDEDHLHKEIMSEKDAEEMKKAWENSIQGFYDAARTPIIKDQKTVDWGSGKSFNSTLSEEERLKRNMEGTDE